MDIVHKVFEASGHTIRVAVRPWNRAVHEMNAGQYIGLLGTFPEITPDLIFPEQESGMIRGCLYVVADNPLQYDGSDSLAGMVFGGIQGYFYGPLQDYIDQQKESDAVQLLAGTDALSRNMKKLFAGRIDIVGEDQSVMRYFLQQQGWTERVREAGCVVEKAMYIAFSPQISQAQEYAQLLDKGLDELRASGELHAILSQYGLKDWRETP